MSNLWVVLFDFAVIYHSTSAVDPLNILGPYSITPTNYVT